ncbi:MAG TPA: peptidase M54 [Myxococcales bacterium]|jgi:archaemetzincin|nr:peptidase M54 [Myxococcales bacterium]
MAGVVQLVPIGTASRALFRELAEPLAVTLGVETVVGSSLADPKYAFNKDRNQYHSSAILRRLAAMRAKKQIGVLGLTEIDLFVPELDFVFGESDRESGASLLSLTRLRPEFYGEPQDMDRVRARGRVELLHEVGHLLGLSHCEDARCPMFAAILAADTDRKTRALCSNCRAELARLSRGR